MLTKEMSGETKQLQMLPHRCAELCCAVGGILLA